MSDDYSKIDAADSEIVGFTATSGVLAVVGFVLRAHPVLAVPAFALSAISLALGFRRGHQLNRDPDNPPNSSSLNGRLDIDRSSGL